MKVQGNENMNEIRLNILLKIANIFPRTYISAGTKLSPILLYVFSFLPVILISYFMSLGMISSFDNFFSTVLIISGLIVYFMGAGRDIPYEVKFFIALGLILFAMVMLHSMFSRDYLMIFNFQFENLRNLVLLPLIAVLVVFLKLDAQGIWRVIVLSGVYTFFYSVMVFIESPQRGEGLLEYAINVGNIAMLFSLMSLVAFFGLKGNFWIFLAIFVFVSGFALSLLSGTRAGWLAFPIALILLLWVFWYVNRKYFFSLIGLAFIVFVLVLIFWHYLPIEQRVLMAVSDIENYLNGYSNTSVGQRFDMWIIAFHAFLEKPVFGWGVVPYYDTFLNYLQYGLINYDLPEVGGGFAQPHNDYLFLLYHFGLVGFLLAMLFIFYPMYKFICHVNKYKNNNPEQVFIALTALVAFESMLDFMLFNLAMMNKIFYLVLVVGLMVLFHIRFFDMRFESDVKDNSSI
jgi:O-antigen ligase